MPFVFGLHTSALISYQLVPKHIVNTAVEIEVDDVMAAFKILIFIAVVSMFQALIQFVFTALGLLQYFCIIDFLRDLPILVYLKILYFHNPNYCGARINIGHSIESIADQAFVLMTREPVTATRTFIINSISLGLSIVWIIACLTLLRSGTNKQLQCWSWVLVTVAVSGVDLVATVTYANDSFHTQTLMDMMEFIGGTASGIGSVDLNTAMTAWVMVIVYSRFVILFFLNIIFVVCVVFHSRAKRVVENTAVVEAPDEVRSEPKSEKDEQEVDLPSETPHQLLPRPGLRHSFRQVKEQLLEDSLPAARSLPNSLDVVPMRSVQPQQKADKGKKRSASFSEHLVYLSHKLENMIDEQQKRIDKTGAYGAGLNSSSRITQSIPQLPSTSTDGYRRRDTAAELQGQLPWAYVSTSAHRMRDQLPSDEDLPPVPLPDYTAIPSFRKASVHRAASSLSSFTHKRDNKIHTQSQLHQSDVLY